MKFLTTWAIPNSAGKASIHPHYTPSIAAYGGVKYHILPDAIGAYIIVLSSVIIGRIYRIDGNVR